MASVEKITVEVAHALPERQVILELSVDPGTTIEQAIRTSGILEQFPEIDLNIKSISTSTRSAFSASRAS
jgi:putative ubiquitin-RnfH superfamily antitoxin RatB of RatAB toxin-antitoxin module